MKLLTLFLIALSLLAQPVVNSRTESAIGDTDVHIRLVLDSAVSSSNKVFLAYSTSTLSTCTAGGGVELTLGDPTGADGLTTANPEFIITGLTKNTLYYYNACQGTTVLTGSSPPYTFTTANSTDTHPLPPVPPNSAAVSWSGVTPGAWNTERTTDGTCSDLLSKMTDAANAGAGTHKVTVPSGSAMGACSITTPTHSAGTVYIVPSNLDRLPPDQARVSLLLDAQHMYTMRPASTPCINQTTANWRIIGLDCRPQSTTTYFANFLLQAGNTNFFCDRCIISSHLAPAGATRTFAMGNGTSNIGIVNSYVHQNSDGVNEVAGIAGDFVNGALIQNNTLEGATTASVFATDSGTTVNTNWIVRWNTFDGDERLLKGSATNTPAGTWYPMRQALEFKRCVQCQITGNIFKNYWTDLAGAASAPILMSVRMVNPAARAMSDIEIAYNFVTHSSGFLQITAKDDSAGREPYPVQRIWVHDNINVNIDETYKPTGCYPGGTGSCTSSVALFLRMSGMTDLKFDHNTHYEYSNTIFGSRMLDILDPKCGDCKFDDNIAIYRDNGGLGGCRWSGSQWPDGSTPAACVDKLGELWPRYSFKGNLIRAKTPSTVASITSLLPTGNTFSGDDAAGLTAIGFKNGSITSTDWKDFSILASSAYRAASQDGRNPGADIVKMGENIGGVEYFGITNVTATSISASLKAPGGLTGVGTACLIDANTSATFANAPIRGTFTVNASTLRDQTITLGGLTTGTTYYLRVYCKGDPYVYGGESTPIAVVTP